MHFGDDELVAHLDGELPFGKRGKVRRHLESCWQCRARAAAFENQILDLAGRSQKSSFPDPQWTDRQRSGFRRRMWQFENTLRHEQTRRAPAKVFALSGIALAVSVALILSVALWSGKNEAKRIVPAEAIANVQSVEQALYSRSVEQVFDVRITQTIPVRVSLRSKLQIWSDRSTSRFASKWTDEKGTLKHALWQPAADSEFVYQPALAAAGPQRRTHAPDTGPLLSLADRGLDPGQLEAGFERWMERRSWTPVAFTPELSVWAERDGAFATAGRIVDPNGGVLLRITARKRMRGITATLTIDVDPRTWWPRCQAIRFVSAERSIEFRLTSNRIRPVALSELSAAVFQPVVPVSNRTSAPARVLPIPEVPQEPDRPVHVMAEKAAQAVEAHYVLHQVGACLGEPVKIEQETGGIRVWNLGGSSETWPPAFTSQANLENVSGALADLRSAQSPLIEGRDVHLPASALRHAWAIRNLASDFPSARVAGLPEKFWRLLESILQDHMTALRRDLGASARRGRAAAPTPLPGSNWRESAATLYELLLHRREQPSSAAESFEDLDLQLDAIAIGFAGESRSSWALSGRIIHR